MSCITYKEEKDTYPDSNIYEPIYSSESDSDISISNSSIDTDIDYNRKWNTTLSSYNTNTYLGTEDFKFNKSFLKIILNPFVITILAVLLYFLFNC